MTRPSEGAAATDARVGPGPVWLWVTAWSMQGTGVMLVDRLGIEDAWVWIGCVGGVAALPLLVLYLVVSRCGWAQNCNR